MSVLSSNLRLNGLGLLFLLCCCQLGCRTGGVMSFPGCNEAQARIKLQSVASTAEGGRVVRVMHLVVRSESWFAKQSEPHSLVNVEMRVTSPEGPGTYGCGDESKPCQATIERVGSTVGQEHPILTGDILVSQAGALSGEFEWRPVPSRGSRCPLFRIVLDSVPMNQEAIR